MADSNGHIAFASELSALPSWKGKNIRIKRGGCRRVYNYQVIPILDGAQWRACVSVGLGGRMKAQRIHLLDAMANQGVSVCEVEFAGEKRALEEQRIPVWIVRPHIAVRD